MEEGKVARVLQDFFTTNDGELSLQKGDIVQILKMIDKLWCYGCHNGRTGNMPLNYLIVVNHPDLNPEEELFVAIASFPVQQSGDLSFQKGDLIVGIQQVDDNWWQGKIETRTGLFPATYTWQLNSSLLKKKSRSPPKNMKALVKKDMKAQLDEEVDLYVGDVISVFEIIDKDWYRGESRGKIGIFPSAFVSILNETESPLPMSSSTNTFSSTSAHSGYSTNSSDVDGPPSYFDVFGSTLASTSSSTGYSSASNTCDVFDDDYFKQNAPNTFFGEQNDNQFNLLDVGHKKDLGLEPYGISLYPFHAQFDNELSFEEGEIVTLIRYISKDWMEGKVNERKGIFPCNYVNVIVDCGRDSDSDTSSVTSIVEGSAMCNDLETESFAAVLYNFDAQMNGDLSIKAGEVVYVIEQANESWCKVRNQAGEIGLCPRSYLTLHGSSNKAKNALFQRFSLANDNLLQDPPRNVPDILERSAENRRSYHREDFSSGSHSKISVDDLISMNLDNLKVHKTWHPKPTSSARTVTDIFERGSNESLPERSENKISSVQNEFSAERRVPSPAVSQLDWQNNVSQSNSQRSSTLSLLDEPVPPTGSVVSVSSASVQPSRFAPPLPASRLKRQVSDRVPHRPAPPVPLPGQKPVRKLEYPSPCQTADTQRLNHNAVNEIASKENQLKYLQHIRDQTVQKIDSGESSSDVTDGEVNLKFQLQAYDEKIKILSGDLETLKGNRANISPAPQPDLTSNAPSCSAVCSEEDKRVRNLEQRQNVISELVMTEKEYVRDLKITFEVFNLHDPCKLENRGINVKVLFGNIFEVMQFAEDFLDKLLLGMKGKDENDQCIGVIFVESAEKMKFVYGEYCMNHDNALSLLEKYETDQNVQKVFNKGLETLRYQIACFDMSSILIKPVQRILKYPLILNELIKCTHDSHQDKSGLLEAVKTVMDVATYINECKRRKDIVSKYLVDGNATISSKMSRITLHSVAKKSTRLGMKVTSTLGFGAVSKDPVFAECEASFHAIEKTIRAFLKNIESFVQHLHEVTLSQCYIADGFGHFYQERHPDVEDFARIQKLVNSQYFKEFDNTVRVRVVEPLNTVLSLFEGPGILIQKRHDKFLDYEFCTSKAEKNKEVRTIQEELLIAKNNYLALNDQLLEELPTLVSVSSDLFVECLSAFVTARKLFTAKVMKNYLAVLEQSKTISTTSDVVESCCVRYNLVLNQLCRLSFISSKKSLNSPTPKLKQPQAEDFSQEMQKQTSSQQAYLKSRYSPDMLYTVIKPCIANEPLELSLNVSHLVGVIKKQNPMGDSKIWFVDDGSNRGFVPASHLKETFDTAPQRHSMSVMPSYQSENLGGAENVVKYSYPGSLKKDAFHSVYRSDNAAYNKYSGISCQDSSQQTKHTYEDIPVRESPPRYCEIPDEPETTIQVYYAMYDFQGDDVKTLTLKTGQVVKILQKHDAENNTEWWLAEDANGKKGFVPGNFLGKRT